MRASDWRLWWNEVRNKVHTVSQHKYVLHMTKEKPMIMLVQHNSHLWWMYLSNCNCLHFNGHFTSEPRSASFLRFIPTLKEQNLWEEVAQVFIGQMPFQSPNQQCQSTKGYIKHWPQPVDRAHPFITNHRTPEEGVLLFLHQPAPVHARECVECKRET